MKENALRSTLQITKALADAQRLRILMLLQEGELCVCQVMEVFGLAMSTISKHLSILAAADLVVSRKEGRWAYYRLPTTHENKQIKTILKWIQQSLQEDEQINNDRRKLTNDVACTPQDLRKRQKKETKA